MKALKILALASMFVFLAVLLSAQKRQTRSMRQADQPIERTAAEIRIELEEYYGHFRLEVIAAADSILSASHDRQVRRNALLWKIHALTSIQRSVLIRDPFVGLVDEAVLTFQMYQFFHSGKGRTVFGQWQPIALRACEQLIERVKTIIGELSEDRDIQQGEKELHQFAREHPIANLYFIRDSAIPALGIHIGLEKAGIGKITRSLEASMEQLEFAVSTSLQELSQQVIWEAELLAMDLPRNIALPDSLQPDVDLALVRLDSLSRQSSRVLRVAENAPGLIEEQRRELMVEIDLLRTQLMADIEAERRAILGGVTRERQAIFEAIGEERQLVLERVSAEREAALAALDRIAEDRIDQALDRVDALVNRILWRVGLFAMGLLLLLILLGLLLRRHWQA